MSRHLKSKFDRIASITIALTLASAYPPCAAGTPDTEGLQVTVFLFNSHFSSRDLTVAEARAAAVFENVGIRVIWVVGLTARDSADHPVGQAWSPADLDLRIWPRSLARGVAIHSNALGYCLSIERGQAVVLSDVIDDIAASWGIDVADILGVTIAHEIGHLLLKTSTHPKLGVMKARYVQEDFGSAGPESLRFTRAEGNAMRDEARRRMGLETFIGGKARNRQ